MARHGLAVDSQAGVAAGDQWGRLVNYKECALS